MLQQKSSAPARLESFGQAHRLTTVDCFGVWLSARQLRRHARFGGKRVADFGCGFHANFARTVIDEAAHVTLIDVSLAADLKRHPKVSGIEGGLPESLVDIPNASMDVILGVSVIE